MGWFLSKDEIKDFFPTPSSGVVFVLYMAMFVSQGLLGKYNIKRTLASKIKKHNYQKYFLSNLQGESVTIGTQYTG